MGIVQWKDSNADGVAEAVYANRMGIARIVAPPEFNPLQMAATVGVMGSLTPKVTRVIASEAGFVRDLSVYVSTNSGNVSVAIYDTGDAAGSGTRTKLWSSSSVAMSGFVTSTWNIVADPGSGTVPCYAGQQFDFAIVADNGTAQFGRFTTGAAAEYSLPTGFNPVPGGAAAKMSGTFAALTPGVTDWPATVTEANVLTATNALVPVIARVG